MATSARTWRTACVALLAISLGGCTRASEHTQSVRHPATPTATPTPSPTSTELPVKGGTLHVLSSGTDYLDANLSYYSVGYSILRLISRQLYSWPADPANATTVVPDLATGPPTVDATGTVYTMTIRHGARWETSPPRQVTAADVVRGVEITCNPLEPSGALPDFESLIRGMSDFCAAFSKQHPRTRAIRSFLSRNVLPGVHVGANPLQVVFELTRPANYFPDLLTLPALSPRPREMLAEPPGGNRGVSHPISDGPYRLASQIPADYGAPAELTFDRNPAWDPATDQVRKAYVDKIDIDLRAEASDPRKALRVLKHDGADLCLCGIGRPYSARLLHQHDRRLTLHPSFADNPYLVFNTASPNNDGALRNPAVRRAISYALNRSAFTKALGGPQLAPPLTHVLPDGMLGAQPFDPYPHDPAKARALLSKAGVGRLDIALYYNPASQTSQELFRAIRRQLAVIGVRVQPRLPWDFYGAELHRQEYARHGAWDLAIAGWFPDWDGNAAASYFHSLFDGRTLPPTSSDFGLYDDPKLDALIDRASQADLKASADLWHQADELVMTDAAIYPIAQQNLTMWCGDRVGNCIYVPDLEGADLTNVWHRLHR